MMKIISTSCMLQWLILMPVSFTVLKFLMPPGLALLLSGILCIVSLAANLLCRCKLKGYLYKIISLTASVLLALLLVKPGLAALLTAAIFMIVFLREKSCYGSEDLGGQIVFLGLLLNILLALVNTLPFAKAWAAYGNAAVFISTITSVAFLIVKQVDDSRKFGKKSMGISTTQRKNNMLFGGIAIALAIGLGTVGQVSALYLMVLNLFSKLFTLLSYLFALSRTENSQQPAGQMQNRMNLLPAEEPSLFAVIINAILYTIGVLLVLAVLGLGVYLLIKLVMRLAKSFLRWLRHEEGSTLRVWESGHVDEKESIYNKNLKKLVGRLEDAARHLFDRELPYSKLTDPKEKIRRLFKYYVSNVQKAGVKASPSSTASEICKEASAVQPKDDQHHTLMGDCYNAARYGDVEPSEEKLRQLESKILK